MSIWLSDRELARTKPAQEKSFRTPIPTQIVSNGEFNPLPQTPQQRRVEARLRELADVHARKLGITRRAFLRSSCGLATAFLAMNEVFGSLFHVGEAEASEPGAAAERQGALVQQFIFDDQVHFVHDGFRQEALLDLARFASKHWNPEMLEDVGITMKRYQFDNFLKEIFLDSETDVALLSNAPSDLPDWRLLSNEQAARAREVVNSVAGSRRLLCHAILSPRQSGALEEVDRILEELRPDGWKGYSIGDPLRPSQFAWRLDDEKVAYPFYEKLLKAGMHTLCIHKGLLPLDYEKSFSAIWEYATVDDLPKAAKDWPEINFVIYHAALRPFLELPDGELAEFERSGRIRWASDLAAIPSTHGVTNVYAEVGTSFANSAVANPRFCAAFLGTLIKGMGVERLLWGTDSVWYGSPQWQIEALRRLEIPEEMQRKHGFAPLGAADGEVKNRILGLNAASLYGVEPVARSQAVASDDLTRMKLRYHAGEPSRSNAAYGFIARS